VNDKKAFGEFTVESEDFTRSKFHPFVFVFMSALFMFLHALGNAVRVRADTADLVRGICYNS
jgi:hypothetical protein